MIERIATSVGSPGRWPLFWSCYQSHYYYSEFAKCDSVLSRFLQHHVSFEECCGQNCRCIMSGFFVFAVENLSHPLSWHSIYVAECFDLIRYATALRRDLCQLIPTYGKSRPSHPSRPSNDVCSFWNSSCCSVPGRAFLSSSLSTPGSH